MIVMVGVFSLEGEKIKDIELPKVFKEEIREDLIRRAFLASYSRRFQPYGTNPRAGLGSSAKYVGKRHTRWSIINRGISRLPRLLRYDFTVRLVPQARGGRRAHPPKVEKILVEKINKKEYLKALKSAIAATSNLEYVLRRGHIYTGDVVPLVVVDDFKNLEKTKDVYNVLKKLNLEGDLIRAKQKKIRAGKGKMRGRRYRRKKSVLIIVDEESPILKAARNIPGVDIITVNRLNIEYLAPGGTPGRLTIFTEGSLIKIGEKYE